MDVVFINVLSKCILLGYMLCTSTGKSWRFVTYITNTVLLFTEMKSPSGHQISQKTLDLGSSFVGLYNIFDYSINVFFIFYIRGIIYQQV